MLITPGSRLVKRIVFMETITVCLVRVLFSSDSVIESRITSQDYSGNRDLNRDLISTRRGGEKGPCVTAEVARENKYRLHLNWRYYLDCYSSPNVNAQAEGLRRSNQRLGLRVFQLRALSALHDPETGRGSRGPACRPLLM
jgi:hypothetical protein